MRMAGMIPFPNLSLPSQQVVSGVTAALGVLIVALAALLLGDRHIAAAMAVGATCASIVDIPDALEHKLAGFAIACGLGGLISFGVGIAAGHLWLAGGIVVATSFTAALITAYGRPAMPLSMALILAMVLAFGTPLQGEIPALQHAVLFALGGVAYAAYGMLAGWLLDSRHRQLALADSIHALAEYIRIKARLYDTDIGIEHTYAELIERQVVLMERVQAARNLLFRRMHGTYDRQMAAALVAALDAFEMLLSSQTDYWQLRNRLGKALAMTAIRDGIIDCAGILDGLAKEVRDGESGPSFARIQARFADIAGMAEKMTVNTDITADHREAVTVLQHTVATIRRSIDSLAALQLVARDVTAADMRLKDIDLEAFLPPKPYRLKTLGRQLRYRSPIFRYALRLSAAMLCAFALSVALAAYIPHGNWIMLTVAVIMRASYSATRQRQKDRVIGNLLGCVMAAFLLYLLPDAALLAVTAVAIGFSHAYAPVRYRVTSTAACVMALLMMHFVNPGGEALALERLLDTMIGAGIAFLFSFMFPVWERQGLRERIAALLQAERNYALQALKSNPTEQSYRLARKQAFDAIGDLAGAIQRLPDEPGAVSQDTAKLQQFLAANYRLATYLAGVQVLLRMRGSDIDPALLESLLSIHRDGLQARLAGQSGDQIPPHQAQEAAAALARRLTETMVVAQEIHDLAGALPAAVRS